MAPIVPIIGALLPVVQDMVRNLFPDPEQQAKAQQVATQALLDNSARIEEAASSIIRQEAASQHWLAANWRPLTMLTFVVLIVLRWCGITAPDLSEAEYLKLWDIVEFGLGGYTVGRTVEKVTPMIAESLVNRGKQ